MNIMLTCDKLYQLSKQLKFVRVNSKYPHISKHYLSVNLVSPKSYDISRKMLNVIPLPIHHLTEMEGKQFNFSITFTHIHESDLSFIAVFRLK